MDGRTPRYKEFVPLVTWARILTWGAVAWALYSVSRDPNLSTTASSLALAGVFSLGLAVEFVLGGLTIELFDTDLRVSLGRVGWIKKTVPYSTIVRIEAVTYRPIREFGGWGVRGFGSKQAWTARGNRALVLHREDGSQLYVGSDHPERLAERLRGLAKRRFDGLDASI